MSLRKFTEDYLRERGWYIEQPEGDDDPRAADYYWTLPEWGEYWQGPPPSTDLHRRYVTFAKAIEITMATELGGWHGVPEERAADWIRRRVVP